MTNHKIYAQKLPKNTHLEIAIVIKNNLSSTKWINICNRYSAHVHACDT